MKRRLFLAAIAAAPPAALLMRFHSAKAALESMAHSDGAVAAVDITELTPEKICSLDECGRFVLSVGATSITIFS